MWHIFFPGKFHVLSRVFQKLFFYFLSGKFHRFFRQKVPTFPDSILFQTRREPLLIFPAVIGPFSRGMFMSFPGFFSDYFLFSNPGNFHSFSRQKSSHVPGFRVVFFTRGISNLFPAQKFHFPGFNAVLNPGNTSQFSRRSLILFPEEFSCPFPDFSIIIFGFLTREIS